MTPEVRKQVNTNSRNIRSQVVEDITASWRAMRFPIVMAGVCAIICLIAAALFSGCIRQADTAALEAAARLYTHTSIRIEQHEARLAILETRQAQIVNVVNNQGAALQQAAQGKER